MSQRSRNTERIKISICGLPRAGKVTLIRALAADGEESEFRRFMAPSEGGVIFEALVTKRSKHYLFTCIQGSFLDLAQLPSRLMEASAGVIYVFPSIWPDDADGDLYVDESHFWNAYSEQAEGVGVGCGSVPWHFVQNKMDLGSKSYFEQIVQGRKQRNIIKTIAISKDPKLNGIPELWESLLMTLRSDASASVGESQ